MSSIYLITLYGRITSLKTILLRFLPMLCYTFWYFHVRAPLCRSVALITIQVNVCGYSTSATINDGEGTGSISKVCMQQSFTPYLTGKHLVQSHTNMPVRTRRKEFPSTNKWHAGGKKTLEATKGSHDLRGKW